MYRGGVPEFAGCYGLANRSDEVPVRPWTRFALASVSKMFTAAAVASLVRATAGRVGTLVAEVLPLERRPATLRRT